MASNSPDGVMAMDDWYRQFAPKEMSEVKYCMAVAAPVSHLNFVSKRVEGPADLKGLRMRPTNAIIGRYMASVGASLVSVPASEAAQAFERGLLDGMILSWRTLIPFGLDKHVKVHLDFPFAVNPSAFVINKKKYDSLNAAQRAIIDQHCSPEWAHRLAKMWNDWEDEGRSIFEKQGGHTFYKPSAANAAAWRAAAEKIHLDWIKEAGEKGYDGTKAMDDLRQRIKARNASF
jgi:TRAP-type C4-dicarboxylate transport system substrate-binding protein